MKKLALLALGLMFVFSMGVFVVAEEKKADDANKAIFEKIQGVVDITFDNTPFVDAVQQLGEKLGVKMVVDDSIKDAVKDVKISKELKETNIRMVLAWMAGQAKVKYEVKDGAIVFTKGEARGM